MNGAVPVGHQHIWEQAAENTESRDRTTGAGVNERITLERLNGAPATGEHIWLWAAIIPESAAFTGQSEPAVVW